MPKRLSWLKEWKQKYLDIESLPLRLLWKKWGMYTDNDCISGWGAWRGAQNVLWISLKENHLQPRGSERASWVVVLRSGPCARQSSFALLLVSVPMPPVQKAFSDSRHLKLKSTWKRRVGSALVPSGPDQWTSWFYCTEVSPRELVSNADARVFHLRCWIGESASVMKPAYFFK